MALVITSYLFYLHYKPDITGICQPGETFDCSLVSQSPYAYIWGVPVSLWGLLFYGSFFLLSLALYSGFKLSHIHRKFKRKHAYWLVFLIPLFGTVFSLRLSYIEAFILKAWCPFCIMQQVVVFLMLIFSILLLRQRKM